MIIRGGLYIRRGGCGGGLPEGGKYAEDQYCPSERTRRNHRCGYFRVIASGPLRPIVCHQSFVLLAVKVTRVSFARNIQKSRLESSRVSFRRCKSVYNLISSRWLVDGVLRFDYPSYVRSFRKSTSPIPISHPMAMIMRSAVAGETLVLVK